MDKIDPRGRPRSRLRRRVRWGWATVALLMATGCTGAGGEAGASGTGAPATGVVSAATDNFDPYHQCMDDAGFGSPDPDLGEVDLDAMAAADAECSGLVNETTPSSEIVPNVERADPALAKAQADYQTCMAEQGVDMAQLDDPSLDIRNVDVDAMAAADRACGYIFAPFGVPLPGTVEPEMEQCMNHRGFTVRTPDAPDRTLPDDMDWDAFSVAMIECQEESGVHNSGGDNSGGDKPGSGPG